MNTTRPADAHVPVVIGAARLRRVGAGDLLAPRDYVHVRAEVADAP